MSIGERLLQSEPELSTFHEAALNPLDQISLARLMTYFVAAHVSSGIWISDQFDFVDKLLSPFVPRRIVSQPHNAVGRQWIDKNANYRFSFLVLS